jgi:beta-lactamase regulating signal transducer with metallopeptidase domain
MKPIEALPDWTAALIEASLQAAVLVPVILLVQWLFRRQLTARWKHALWWLLVLRLLRGCSAWS